MIPDALLNFLAGAVQFFTGRFPVFTLHLPETNVTEATRWLYTLDWWIPVSETGNILGFLLAIQFAMHGYKGVMKLLELVASLL